jgi:hypothetical protein
MDPLNKATVPRPAYGQTQGKYWETMADQRRTYLGFDVTPLSSTALEFENNGEVIGGIFLLVRMDVKTNLCG